MQHANVLISLGMQYWQGVQVQHTNHPVILVANSCVCIIPTLSDQLARLPGNILAILVDGNGVLAKASSLRYYT